MFQFIFIAVKMDLKSVPNVHYVELNIFFTLGKCGKPIAGSQKFKCMHMKLLLNTERSLLTPDKLFCVDLYTPYDS